MLISLQLWCVVTNPRQYSLTSPSSTDASVAKIKRYRSGSIPIRGKHDTGSIQVNLITREIIKRGKLEDRVVRPTERVEVAGAMSGAGVVIDERVTLIWAPNDSWKTFVTEFYVIPEAKFDILL